MSTAPKQGRPTRRADSLDRKVTIYDLARHTGFSAGTVSRVLNNRDKVKPETRQAILDAAKELDLKPRVSVRSRQIAILSEPNYSDRIEGYAATLTAHLSFACSRRNMGVVLPTDPLEQLTGLFLDGIVAVTFDTQLSEFLQEMEKRVPVVYMDKFGDTEQHYRVCSDHYRSGYLAAEHFIAHGKSRLACYGGEGQGFFERLRGYRDAIVEAGLEVDESLLVKPGSGSRSTVLTRLARSGADSIFVPGSSLQALECLHLLTYVMGKRVPDDISIIGGENEGISEYLHPPLTAIEEPLRDMAEAAVSMLDQLTEGKPVKERSVMLPVKLVARNSV